MNENRKSFNLRERPKDNLKPVKLFDSFYSVEKLKEYKKWKKKVDRQFRQLVEVNLKGKKAKIDKEYSPLVNQFYNSCYPLLKEPNIDVGKLELDERTKRMLKLLQDVEINERGDRVNIWRVLGDKKIGFGSKTEYFSNFISSKIAWLKSQDKNDLEKYLKKREEGKEIEINPDEEKDEYEPHRSLGEKMEGEPTEAIASVYSFFGGYYKSGSYQYFDVETLKWRKAKKEFSSLKEQKIEEEKKRIDRKAIFGGQRIVIELPQKWGLNHSSIKWLGKEPEEFSFWQDQNGLAYLKVRGLENQKYNFSLEIGPSSEYLKSKEPLSDEKIIEGEIELPKDLLEKAKKISEENIPLANKFRRIVSFIRQNLKYDKDDFSLEGIYKRDKKKYCLEIWKNKKAKCDEANTLAGLVLNNFDYKFRFIEGHSVLAKSAQGEALLLNENRHAWLEGYDEENKEWIRLDATPEGDPNVNQEEQEEDLSESDWGEQEAEIMSDEELEKALADMEKKEEENSTKPEVIFAREANCSPEEAKKVLEKIINLRKKYKKEIEEMDNYWLQVLRKNYKEKLVYKGPVRQSRGNHLDDPVFAFIDIKSGENDPTGFVKEKKILQKEKIFGGYDVYLLADMSGSMDWLLNGIKKSESQRDMVFLLADRIMTGAVVIKQKERKLKYPMPNKVSLMVFGKETEIVLPLTDKWGPVEQIKIYRALDKTAEGSTPDHLALEMAEVQIKESKKEEEKIRQRKAKKNKDWQVNRFVIATADGGSDNFGQVKAVNNRLVEMNIPSTLLLICQEKDANIQKVASQAYQEVVPVSDITGLSKQGMATLIKRIKEIYGE
jgi:hypothetical protein